MKKILVVFGTRPEAIKLAPLIISLKANLIDFKTIICVTGQHREMLDQVLELFSIKPDIDLNIMKAGQDLTDVTVRVLRGIRDVLKVEMPDLVLVHGDTTTSMATSLASFYLQIPVGHIEAGLRTYDKYSPWPEELNRQINSKIATYHFAPTELNRQNLLKEGIRAEDIIVTGNTVIDALHIALGKINESKEVKDSTERSLEASGIGSSIFSKWDGEKGYRKMILVTGHRRENFGQGFSNICEAIKELALKHPGLDFVYPMHLNPNVRMAIENILTPKISGQVENIFLIEPLGYLPFIWLMKKCYMVLTDSGGIQEEAPALGKPVLVMRDTTERPEALQSGTIKLTGTSKNTIIEEVEHLLDSSNYSRMSKLNNPYGDGQASVRIINTLLK